MNSNRICIRTERVLLAFALLIGAVAAGAPTATAEGPCGADGLQASGAVYRICMPSEGEWNHDLVVYAHGYVAYDRPIEIPEDQLTLPDGSYLPQMITDLGYAFAVTSYSMNGLAIKQGLADLVDLVGIFTEQYGEPEHVYLAGPSEGGLITALGIERHADVFDGGLSTCGPVGDFWKQINYLGDVRVVFDVLFPNVLPGSAVNIPQDVIDNWQSVYAPLAEGALEADLHAADQLIRVARIPVDPQDDTSRIPATMGALWYNVFATNDIREKLGGVPYENRAKFYLGSDNDWLLNRRVERVRADDQALAELESHCQTSGALSAPLVTMHTLGDPIVPYWHEPLYLAKIASSGTWAEYTHIPVILQYGHCTFTASHVMLAFSLLVYKVTDTVPTDVLAVLPDEIARSEYRTLAVKYGLGY